MRVTVIASDLSGNSLGRALILAEVLAQDHEVALLGTFFGEGLWPPASGHGANLRGVRGRRWPGYLRTVYRLGDMVEADAIVAVKPRLPSYGAALLARRRGNFPVVLDIDDDETALKPIPTHPVALLHEAAHPDGALSRRIMKHYIDSADACTVASETLRGRYGGELVWHVKDTDRLRPTREGRVHWRRRWEVGGERVVLFLGTPRSWKGLEEAARAVARSSVPATLMVVGADEHEYTRFIAGLPGVRTWGMTPMESLPGVLSAADLVIIPQRDEPITRAQMPSKLFDAMALAKPIVATAVSDIPLVLSEGRGRVVPPGDETALSAAVDDLLSDPAAAAEMGSRARRWCEEHASIESARAPLRRALERAVRRRS